MVFEEWGIGVIVTYRGKHVMEGKKCTKTGLWMVPIKDEANSSKRANFMHVKTPNDTYFGVNQQVNSYQPKRLVGQNPKKENPYM